MAKNIIPYADLKKRGIPFSRGHIYKLEKAKQFPKHVIVSTARVGWLEEDIDNWVDELRERRDSGEHTTAHARTERARAARARAISKDGGKDRESRRG
jgi:prophage regulatory protein